MCRTQLGVPLYRHVSSRDGDVKAAGRGAGEITERRARYTELALESHVEYCPIMQLPMEHPVNALLCKHRFEKTALEVRGLKFLDPIACVSPSLLVGVYPMLFL